jgi:hypothetical protein
MRHSFGLLAALAPAFDAALLTATAGFASAPPFSRGTSAGRRRREQRAEVPRGRQHGPLQDQGRATEAVADSVFVKASKPHYYDGPLALHGMTRPSSPSPPGMGAGPTSQRRPPRSSSWDRSRQRCHSRDSRQLELRGCDLAGGLDRRTTERSDPRLSRHLPTSIAGETQMHHGAI